VSQLEAVSKELTSRDLGIRLTMIFYILFRICALLQVVMNSGYLRRTLAKSQELFAGWMGLVWIP
jgi:hypothetical protein